MKGYMTTIRAGEIWLAKILFTDASASKKRPVLVLWLDGNDAVVAAVTSAAPRSMTDVGLADWKASGLRVASTVRLSRLDCLEQSLRRPCSSLTRLPNYPIPAAPPSAGRVPRRGRAWPACSTLRAACRDQEARRPPRPANW